MLKCEHVKIKFSIQFNFRKCYALKVVWLFCSFLRFTTNSAAAGLSENQNGLGSETSILIDKALEHNDALDVSQSL